LKGNPETNTVTCPLNKKKKPGNLLQRIFRVCPFRYYPGIRLSRRLVDHAAAGAILGFLVFHPLSMVAHDLFGFSLTLSKVWSAVLASFSLEHASMTAYFVLIGCIFGLVHGGYIHIISRLHEEVSILAITDELTSLFNRRYFMNRLNQELARSRRYGHKLSLMMIDLDFFKGYNDMHGHQAGDELLKALASCFRSLVRGSDWAARYGGEEFVIVMPETNREQTIALAERICAGIARYPFTYGEQQPGGKVTVSIGTAEFPSDADSLGDLIRKADQAMYRAKETGRNRVCHTRSRGSFKD